MYPEQVTLITTYQSFLCPRQSRSNFLGSIPITLPLGATSFSESVWQRSTIKLSGTSYTIHLVPLVQTTWMQTSSMCLQTICISHTSTNTRWSWNATKWTYAYITR